MITAAAFDSAYLHDLDKFQEYMELISEDRRAHVNEATNLAVRCERLGASYILEKLLWERHQERPFRYKILESGKPVLLDSDLHFSISHSGGICIAAVSDNPIGVDIEAYDRFSNSRVSKYFTRYDNEYIDAARSEDIRCHRMAEVWTYKEALAKCLDRPLMQVLQWIDFHESQDGSKREMKWLKNCFEFKNQYITIIHQDNERLVNVGFYDPVDGKYY